MTTPPEPNEQAQALVNQLRKLRERVPLTQDEAANALSGSRHQVHRIENGRVPGHDELRAMLNLYGASSEERVICLALWELAWRPDGRRVRSTRLRYEPSNRADSA